VTSHSRAERLTSCSQPNLLRRHSTSRERGARGLQVPRATPAGSCFSSDSSATRRLSREFSFSRLLEPFGLLELQPALLLSPPIGQARQITGVVAPFGGALNFGRAGGRLRRYRKRQHLRYRSRVDPEPPSDLTSAQPFHTPHTARRTCPYSSTPFIPRPSPFQAKVRLASSRRNGAARVERQTPQPFNTEIEIDSCFLHLIGPAFVHAAHHRYFVTKGEQLVGLLALTRKLGLGRTVAFLWARTTQAR